MSEENSVAPSWAPHEAQGQEQAPSRVDGAAEDAGAVARAVRAAIKTRDKFLAIADAQPFDDALFHAAQQAACGWQVFAEELAGGDPAIARLVK